MLLISDLVKELDSYLDKESVANIYEAYLFGAEAHDGQKRRTGEPYIYHPIAVAYILAQLQCDGHTIIAAILHDVIEDTPVAKEQISKQFGEEVAHMVDGVSKLEGVAKKTTKQAQADNFRKLMFAMSSDMRVIVIKVADRLHNMRTLYGMPADKRKRISKETADVYIPLADRLGMYEIKHELEDLVLQNTHPIRYRVLEKSMRKLRGQMYEKNQEIIAAISERLQKIEVEADLHYREKTLASIYKKMRSQNLKFSDVDDIYALRAITNSTDSCYRILGLMHNLYKPVLGKFKDYIAIPKVNSYQSLHTILFVRDHHTVEVQIRTKEMDVMAESGIAAHWDYKSRDKLSGESLLNKSTRKWMKQISELQYAANDSEEFLESIKVDLFANRIFVFSPKGKIFELPRGSTILDFAYAIHTEVGNHCQSALIKNKKVYIGTELINGQTVKIITSDKVTPVPSWLDIVATGRASTTIKNSLRKRSAAATQELGKKMLYSGLDKRSVFFDDISDERWKGLLELLHLSSLEELYQDLGLGNRIPDFVIESLLGQESGDLKSRWKNILKKVSFIKPKKNDLAISGTEGLAIDYAKCCLPLPGDKIIGYIKAGRGIVIHEHRCNNLKRHKKYAERITPLHWEKSVEGYFDTEIIMLLKNKPGVLGSIATEISKYNANINEVETKEVANKVNITMLLSVTSRTHLADIIRGLRKVAAVTTISRAKNRIKSKGVNK